MIKVNGTPIEVTIFPDNTSQVWKLDEALLKPGTLAMVEWEFSHEGEFMHLAQLKTLLDAHLVKSYLVIPYLPYARQDKPVSNGTTFALTTFATLLNSLKFNGVNLVDPHSASAELLINNSSDIFMGSTKSNMLRGLVHGGNKVICFPDKGAAIRYSPYAISSIVGEKTRDQSTGEIIGYKLNCDESRIKDKDVLIVDDICDGGATFKILAKELLAKGAKSVSLYVTHGIFSKGVRTLFESGISKVYTKEGEVSERRSSIQM